MPDNSVDAVVTDPPYGLSFMGKRWDYDVPSVDVWAECLRVLKPGGHLLAFAGTRTQHRMAVRIEDAGFEIRDMIAWVYGSGFPKSLAVSKAIDKAAGAEREVVGVDEEWIKRTGYSAGGSTYTTDTFGSASGPNAGKITTPATDAAKQWDGWGTALKPALEPITVARKPLVGTVAENVQKHGTGALNVDGCRVSGEGYSTGGKNKSVAFGSSLEKQERCDGRNGRWPANLIHDGSEEVTGLFPVTAPAKAAPRNPSGKKDTNAFGDYGAQPGVIGGHNDNGGSAARFFYCAKASKADRDEGCEGLEAKRTTFADGTGLRNNGDGTPRNQKPSNRNHHPTVKPTALMRYLCRLVTPPGGVVLDPFMGSGSTGKAAILEGFRFIGCEREAEYLDIARARIAAAEKKAA